VFDNEANKLTSKGGFNLGLGWFL